MLRIGQGYDSHRFGEGRKLILGGVEIPYHLGMLGHSDGDVVIHAICDALLGAAALGDIGQHFPDTTEEFRNLNSRVFLIKIADLLQRHQYKIVNVDVTIIAEAPKMAPYIAAMRENIANDLAVAIDQISIKAKTNEKMGFIGRNEGIAVLAIALIT